MKRIVFHSGLVSLIVLLATIVGGAFRSQAASLTERYDGARKNYQRLAGTLPDIPDRAPWLQVIADLSAILADDRRGEVSERCLYLIGQCHHHLYDRFREPVHFDRAMRAYRRLIQDFPASRLADDAQFLIGVLYAELNPAQAVQELLKVTTQYPNGDMSERAQAQVRELEGRRRSGSAGPAPAQPSAPARAVLDQVAYWSAKDYTRVAFYLSAPVRYRDNTLPLDPSGKDPARIYIDLEGCAVGPKIGQQIDILDGFLRDVRVGQYRADLTRVVLDIDSIESYQVFTMADPFRIVVDVHGRRRAPEAETDGGKAASAASPPPGAKTTQPAAAKTKGRSEPAAAPAAAKKTPESRAKAGKSAEAPPPDSAAIHSAKKLPSLAQQLGLGVSRIVIDPGHGGRDKGAIGPNGTFEKDLTLAIAKKLRQAIEKNTSCRVIMTRNDDRFISLEERTAIANGEKADLFISIHVNAHEDPTVRGFETYFLNLSRDRESARVAAFENAISKKKISDLEAILQDLLRNTKIKESSRLAATVHRQLANQLSKEYQEFHDLGVKQAPFYVLLGAEMPSILIEAAFLSNPKEEKMLRQQAFQTRIAQSIASGVGRYIAALNQTARLEPTP